MSLEYREFRPSPPLSRWVECYWTLAGEVSGGGEPDRVLPDGRTELIWNLADPFCRQQPGGRRRRQGSALLVGQVTGPFFLAPEGRVSLIAARFRAAALGSFLRGMAASELTDRDLPVDEVLGRRLSDVADAVATALTPEARVTALEASLAADLARATPLDPQVAAAVDLIVASHGRIRIDTLARLTALSGRQLERRFRSAVGIGPKRLARITRFQRLMSRIHQGGAVAWGGLAVSCGYYDQAHLIRDFRQFTGQAPSEFLGTEHRLAEVFLLGMG